MDLQEFIQRLGLEQSSNKEQLKLSKDLSTIIMQRAANRVMSRLSQQEISNLSAVLEQDEEQALSLFNSYAPKYQEIIRQEAVRLQSEILETHDSIIEKIYKKKPYDS